MFHSSGEQPAESFTSIDAVSRWLKAQGEASSSPELQRLHAAVLVLAKKPQPRKEDVRPLFSSWGVCQKEQRKGRPLATLIAELQQAVLAEGARLRGRGLAARTGVSANSSAQPADPSFASGAAGSAEQHAATSAAAMFSYCIQ